MWRNYTESPTTLKQRLNTIDNIQNFAKLLTLAKDYAKIKSLEKKKHTRSTKTN